jgi:phosphohistidine phosphatase SixA
MDHTRRHLMGATSLALGGAFVGGPLLVSSRPALSQPSGATAANTAGQDAIAARLAKGGVALAFRHALAPGTFDPPGFRLNDCSTQRNLDAVGRDQARAIGQWFRSVGLQPAAVRSSPWCRCLETAHLAFGAEQVQPWVALSSPVGTQEQAYPAHQALLREALRNLRSQPGFEVWVTHMFVLQDLVGEGVSSAEALLLESAGSRPRVLGRWRLA